MELDKLNLALRPRHPWEAIDLGLRLYQSHWWPASRALLIGAVPPVFLCLLLAPRYPVIAQFILWWLKPWYDRMLLDVYSRATFGQRLSFIQQLKQIPQLARSGLLSALTVYRFDPSRSFNLPVWQLEGLRGQDRWQRAGILNRGQRGYSTTWLVICFNLELIISSASLVLLWWLLPGNINIDWAYLLLADSESLWINWALTLLYFIVVLIIEPIYVAAGFTHYLSRRIELEGWDIEVNLRRINQRLQQTPALIVLSLVLLLTLPVHSNTAQAQSKPPDAQQAAEIIREVYTDTNLDNKTTRTTFSAEESTQEQNHQDSWLNSIGKTLAVVLKGLVYAIVAAFFIWLTWKIITRKAGFRQQRKKTALHHVQSVAGVDIRTETLPEDIPQAALALIEQQRITEAVSLLYRGALSVLVHYYEVPVNEADTEGDCMAKIARHCRPRITQYCSRLTQSWMQLAYGHQTIDRKQAIALTESWQSSLENRHAL